MITVFSKHGCVNCVTIKKVLNDCGIAYKEKVFKNLYELSKVVDDFSSFPVIKDDENFMEFEEAFQKFADPLLHTPEKFTMYPIQDAEIYNMYKKARASYWQPEEISFVKDNQDWESLTSNEQYFILHILAFFAGSDGIVNKNININFEQEVSLPEAKAFYTFQTAIESVHSETYSILIDKFVSNESEKMKLQKAIETFPSVKLKAEWAFNYMNNDLSFAKRLVAFSCVEGIYFSGSFCAIYWLKKRNLLPGLAFSNELISRDEGLHTDFAVLLYTKLKYKLPESEVHCIIKEAVINENSFINESLPCKLIGMNSELMKQYIEFVADRLVSSLGYSKIYFSENPFDFMENISLEGKTNFFEKRVSEYSKAVYSEQENVFTIDEEF